MLVEIILFYQWWALCSWVCGEVETLLNDKIEA